MSRLLAEVFAGIANRLIESTAPTQPDSTNNSKQTLERPHLTAAPEHWLTMVRARAPHLLQSRTAVMVKTKAHISAQGRTLELPQNNPLHTGSDAKPGQKPIRSNSNQRKQVAGHPILHFSREKTDKVHGTFAKPLSMEFDETISSYEIEEKAISLKTEKLPSGRRITPETKTVLRTQMPESKSDPPPDISSPQPLDVVKSKLKPEETSNRSNSEQKTIPLSRIRDLPIPERRGEHRISKDLLEKRPVTMTLEGKKEAEVLPEAYKCQTSVAESTIRKVRLESGTASTSESVVSVRLETEEKRVSAPGLEFSSDTHSRPSTKRAEFLNRSANERVKMIEGPNLFSPGRHDNWPELAAELEPPLQEEWARSNKEREHLARLEKEQNGELWNG